ncbi:MAG: mercury resistance system periplasmic binding protein MerP [Hyphomicrobiales bacterium]
MTKLLAATMGLALLAGPAAFAAEQTVTLAVENMTCVACPHIVKGSLAAVPGVINVVISLDDKTATVTYDDAKVTVPVLISATTNAGYPSAPKG